MTRTALPAVLGSPPVGALRIVDVALEMGSNVLENRRGKKRQADSVVDPFLVLLTPEIDNAHHLAERASFQLQRALSKWKSVQQEGAVCDRTSY